MRQSHLIIALALALTCSLPALAADWPAFRGPDGNGVSPEKNAPLEWGPDKNIKWKVPLPAGNSSPIVSNGRVFVAYAENRGQKRNLACFDRTNGKQLWVRTVQFDEVMPTHPTNPYSASTPVADGKRVIVFHGSAGLFCYDFDGKQLWATDLGEFRHMWGYASSPVIYGEQVILNAGPGERTAMTAIDLATGKIKWQTREPVSGNGEKRDDGGPVGTWSTPVITKVNGRDQIICAMPTRIVSYNPADGKIIWTCDGVVGRKGNVAYSSVIIAGDIGVYISGYGGPGFAFRLNGRGDITNSGRLWHDEPSPQSIGSGVFIDGYVYLPMAAGGRIQCLDPRTGRTMWEARNEGGDHWGSITAVGKRLYVTAKTGATLVFAANPRQFEPLAMNELGEPSNNTPAVSDGQIFIRTDEHLYCIDAGRRI